MVLTANANAGAQTYPSVVELTFKAVVGAESGTTSIQSIVGTGMLAAVNSAYATNTRWYRNIAGDFVARIIVNTPYHKQYRGDRVTVTITKTSTTTPFALSGVKIYGR